MLSFAHRNTNTSVLSLLIADQKSATLQVLEYMYERTGSRKAYFAAQPKPSRSDARMQARYTPRAAKHTHRQSSSTPNEWRQQTVDNEWAYKKLSCHRVGTVQSNQIKSNLLKAEGPDGHYHYNRYTVT